jgi:hypothetical protein
VASCRFKGLALMDTDLWKRIFEIDYFRTISCGIPIPHAMGSFGTRFRWPSAHSKDRHGGDCCSYTRHWKCPQIVPVVEGELPLLLIYYRLSPMTGWRVIEPPGHHPLQGSSQTMNTQETLTASFLLHVSKSSVFFPTCMFGKKLHVNIDMQKFHVNMHFPPNMHVRKQIARQH